MAMIQVRNVPEELHRRLKVRADKEGVTLSELALNELRRAAEMPTPQELGERLRSRPIRDYRGETAADSTRAERGPCV